MIREESLIGDVAIYSDDLRYRYELRRGVIDPCLGVVMLNPSTATAFGDDPTIRRVQHFAHRWGFGSVVIGNLFAFRSPHPRDLKNIDDPVGPDNDCFLSAIAQRYPTVWVAWGAAPIAEERAAWFDQVARTGGTRLISLGMTESGAPIHPLARGRNRVPDSAMPREWWNRGYV